MSRLPSLFGLIVLLLAAPAAARNLYTGEVALAADGRAGTSEQLEALDQVLARLTGRYGESLVAALGLGADRLDELVLARQLVRRAVVLPSGESAEELRLRVDFDEPSINELLTRNDLPRWGRERPAVLLWAVVADETGSRFIDDPRLDYLIAEQARRVGLEVIRPLHDAMDLGEVSVEDVRGGFVASAEASARRYGAEAIAMLDLRRRDRLAEAPWRGRWRWRVEGRESGVEFSAGEPGELIRIGLERLAATLAARYAVGDVDDQPSRWQVTVSGIVDEVQYAEVLRYLANLSVVSDLQVVAARDRQVTFELEVGARSIEPYLALGGLLAFERRGADRQLYLRLAR